MYLTKKYNNFHLISSWHWQKCSIRPRTKKENSLHFSWTSTVTISFYFIILPILTFSFHFSLFLNLWFIGNSSKSQKSEKSGKFTKDSKRCSHLCLYQDFIQESKTLSPEILICAFTLAIFVELFTNDTIFTPSTDILSSAMISSICSTSRYAGDDIFVDQVVLAQAFEIDHSS